MTDKEVQLIQQLVEKTAARTIPWEPTARDNEFVAPFKGHVTFTISKYEDANHYGESIKLVMRDSSNREMLEVDSNSGYVEADRALVSLYRAAHDSALKVEETIDAILDDLRAAG